jgi:transcriptional regulator with XRE-family HTH domain
MKHKVNKIVSHCELDTSTRLLHIMHMKLARLREKRGLNQRELAEMIGMSAATVQRAEVGEPSAKLETYKKCAEALDVTLADIFSDDLSEAERELVTVFRRIPKGQHDQILGLLRLAQANAPS